MPERITLSMYCVFDNKVLKHKNKQQKLFPTQVLKHPSQDKQPFKKTATNIFNSIMLKHTLLKAIHL